MWLLSQLTRAKKNTETVQGGGFREACSQSPGLFENNKKMISFIWLENGFVKKVLKHRLKKQVRNIMLGRLFIEGNYPTLHMRGAKVWERLGLAVNLRWNWSQFSIMGMITNQRGVSGLCENLLMVQIMFIQKQTFKHHCMSWTEVNFKHGQEAPAPTWRYHLIDTGWNSTLK